MPSQAPYYQYKKAYIVFVEILTHVFDPES